VVEQDSDAEVIEGHSFYLSPDQSAFILKPDTKLTDVGAHFLQDASGGYYSERYLVREGCSGVYQDEFNFSKLEPGMPLSANGWNQVDSSVPGQLEGMVGSKGALITHSSEGRPDFGLLCDKLSTEVFSKYTSLRSSVWKNAKREGLRVLTGNGGTTFARSEKLLEEFTFEARFAPRDSGLHRPRDNSALARIRQRCQVPRNRNPGAAEEAAETMGPAPPEEEVFELPPPTRDDTVDERRPETVGTEDGKTPDPAPLPAGLPVGERGKDGASVIISNPVTVHNVGDGGVVKWGDDEVGLEASDGGVDHMQNDQNSVASSNAVTDVPPYAEEESGSDCGPDTL
jgi:hypothetical protein